MFRYLVLLFTSIFLLTACQQDRSGAVDNRVEKNQSFEQLPSWCWEIDYASFGESQLSIYRQKKRIAHYQFSCNLSDTSLGVEPDAVTAIDKVTPTSHPNGILAVTCGVGAHSVALSIFDPITNTQGPIFQAVGSYYAHWELRDKQLWVTYDQRCLEEPCNRPFKEIEQPWPTKPDLNDN